MNDEPVLERAGIAIFTRRFAVVPGSITIEL
jgi:hypothetical protein